MKVKVHVFTSQYYANVQTVHV